MSLLAGGRRASGRGRLAAPARFCAAARFASGGGRLAVAALAVAAALLVLGAAGCGRHAARSPADAPAAERPSDAQRLTALLRRRARAIERHDARALAATTAPGALRAADRRTLRNLRGVRLAGVRYATDSVTLADERARVDAFESYRVPGIAGSVFSVRRHYRAVRSARSGWRLTSARRGGERQAWDLAALSQTRAPHAVVLAPRTADVAGEGLPAAFDDAYRAVEEALPERPRRRYLVVVAADRRAARRLTPRISGLESLIAIADADVREAPGSGRPLSVISERLVLIWPAYVAEGPVGRRRILEHELTHLVTAQSTSGLTPSWLVEGLALYVSGDRRVGEAARLLQSTVLGPSAAPAARAAHRALALTTLSTPDAIGRLAGPAQGAAYAYASSGAFYIAARYGRARLLRLYRIFAADDLPGAEGPEITDAAVRRVLGIRLVDLERNLRRWIVTRALLFPGNP